jgi:hypothetical protein
LPTSKVLTDGAGVLKRHVPAAKRSHPSRSSEVDLVKWRCVVAQRATA